MAPIYEALFEQVDKGQTDWIAKLAEAVAIPSVSGDPGHRQDVFAMADWLVKLMERLGIQTKKVDPGEQVVDGHKLDLPPILFGQIGHDPHKKTILLYGHYDVQPASKSDGWNTEPFTLAHDEQSGRLYGRGSSDDKGPILGWLYAIEAHLKSPTALPVNLKMVFEGMEESGSEGLDEQIKKEANGFLSNVDAVCISDNYWLNTKTPCLTYGLRGLSYFKVSLSGPKQDLHSGVFGGTVHEPMTDLVYLLSKLVTPQGEILIPGIKDRVQPLTESEKQRYESMDFDHVEYQDSLGGNILLKEEKVDVLMARMRYPSLSLHGIEGAFSGSGSKTVIPATVHGKFSIRLVPNLTPEEVETLVLQYLQTEFNKLGSKNKLKVEMLNGGMPWVADPDHWNFVAGVKATEIVYGKKPDLTREGGSIPVTLTFAETLQKNVMLLPMGRGDDQAHSQNEKLDLSNYIQGTKLMCAYLHEVAAAAIA